MSTCDPYDVEIDDDEKGLYNMNIDAQEKPAMEKSQNFLKKYGEKILLAFGIILIAGISYEAGFLKGQKNKSEPIAVNMPAPCPNDKADNNTGNTANDAATKDAQPIISPQNQKCAFVGSKNSNKYHLPTCVWANKIKPENLVCFSSKEDAEKRGYQPAKDCIK